MSISIRILHTDDTITTASVDGSDYVADFTRLRKADPTIAAIRIDGRPHYQWVGHYTQEHISAVAFRERNDTDNW